MNSLKSLLLAARRGAFFIPGFFFAAVGWLRGAQPVMWIGLFVLTVGIMEILVFWFQHRRTSKDRPR
jgi:hypothetical protein